MMIILTIIVKNPLFTAYLGEGRELVEKAIHFLGLSVMRALQGIKRSDCKQIWRHVYDTSEGKLNLLLYKILLV
jgi:hypothetical protein